MENTEVKSNVTKQKLIRCMDWLQKQNEGPTKLSLQNKNDIQFIIQTNAARKNFLLAAAEDEATVPAGVDEPALEPVPVTTHKLRVKNLNMECEWQSCRIFFNDYDKYQEHVYNHASNVHVIETENGAEYVCLWDVCGHRTSDFKEMIRHLNYHAYHGKLLAIGFNGRATLKLPKCDKDSSKRNQIAVQSEYCCMWVGCENKYNSIQKFIDHVKVHANYADTNTCSWAGCGAMFSKHIMLGVHVRTHTTERLIACYHCGAHFANNRKLSDHVRRQNIPWNGGWACTLCGARCGSRYLLGEHTRQHVSQWACTLCDMSATSAATLAKHIRYRHLGGPAARPHACTHCAYRAVTRWDLRKHIETHEKKKAKDLKEELSDEDYLEAESLLRPVKKKADVKKARRKYVCHMCPEKAMVVFARGSRLTTHLVKEHGAQWSFGHSRFRYQLCNDGNYRLTTTRYESLEVSKKIVDDYTGPQEFASNCDFTLKQVAEPTATTPRQYEINWINAKEEISMETGEETAEEKKVEITMCDVDEKGNIISSEVIKSEFVYTDTQFT